MTYVYHIVDASWPGFSKELKSNYPIAVGFCIEASSKPIKPIFAARLLCILIYLKHIKTCSVWHLISAQALLPEFHAHDRFRRHNWEAWNLHDRQQEKRGLLWCIYCLSLSIWLENHLAWGFERLQVRYTIAVSCIASGWFKKYIIHQKQPVGVIELSWWWFCNTIAQRCDLSSEDGVNPDQS